MEEKKKNVGDKQAMEDFKLKCLIYYHFTTDYKDLMLTWKQIRDLPETGME